MSAVDKKTALWVINKFNISTIDKKSNVSGIELSSNFDSKSKKRSMFALSK